MKRRLAVIGAAKARLEARSRQADTARGRGPDDERRPCHPDGTLKRGGKYQRDFGVPADSDQETFTDPDSRIMKHAGGNFEQSYNGQTAVDAESQIIVAAELSPCAADSGRLPPMLEAVQRNLDTLPAQALADAGYRSEAALENLSDSPWEVIVALGREGKADAAIDADKSPHTAAMAARLATEAGQAAYRRRKAIVEAPKGWIKAVLGFRPCSLRGKGARRVEARLHGPELAADGVFMSRVRRAIADHRPLDALDDQVAQVGASQWRSPVCAQVPQKIPHRP